MNGEPSYRSAHNWNVNCPVETVGFDEPDERARLAAKRLTRTRRQAPRNVALLAAALRAATAVLVLAPTGEAAARVELASPITRTPDLLAPGSSRDMLSQEMDERTVSSQCAGEA